MKLDESTHPGWGDAADYFHRRAKKYAIAEFKIPADIKLKKDELRATPALTTFRNLMVIHDIVPGMLHIPQGTSQSRSLPMRLGSGKTQSFKSRASLPPDTAPDSSMIKKSLPVEPISLFQCTLPSKIIAIL